MLYLAYHLYFLPINLSSLNIEIFLACNLLFLVLNNFFSRYFPLPGTSILLAQPNMYRWKHRVYLDTNSCGVIKFPYHFISQSTFIKVKRVGCPEMFWCQFTKLHGVQPTIQLYWLQSCGFASQCFYVIKSYRKQSFVVTTTRKEFLIRYIIILNIIQYKSTTDCTQPYTLHNTNCSVVQLMSICINLARMRRRHVGDLDRDGSLIMKLILVNWMRRCGRDKDSCER